MSDPIDWGAIPGALAARPQWLLWKFEPNPSKPEKPRKMPYYATGARRTGTQGDDKDRARLVVLDVVRRLYEKGNWSGIGFALLPDDGLIGIDIDGAIDAETGEIRERDRAIIDACASYTELSPSGRGIHIIVEGKTVTNTCDDIGLEIYCDKQFLTFTAKRWQGTPPEVRPIKPDVLAGLQAMVTAGIEAAKEAKRAKAEIEAGLNGRPPPPRQRRAAQPEPGGRVDDFKRVNQQAMIALDTWVPALFPNAKRKGQGYRITSKQLGRDLEEDLAIDPRGIKDFGVADLGDPRDGARTPIDVVMEWLPAATAKEALAWLAGKVGIELTPMRRPPPPPGRSPPPQRPPPAPPGGGAGEPPDDAPPPSSEDEDEPVDWDLIRNRGKPVDCRENVLYCLTHDPTLAGLVAQNTFTELHERTRLTPWGRDAGEWDEEDDLMLGEYLARTHGLLSRSTTTLRAGVQMAARLHKYNPVHDLIRAEPWDQRPRLESWLCEVFEVADRPYVRLIGKLFIMGMVQRALRPGCKFDYMFILKGEQGLQKSSAFRTLAAPWFTDNAIRMGDKDSLMTMQLVWIAESAELESMNKSETTQIKQFLSANEDMFRPPYGARLIKRPRHAVNTGTTNADTFLKDATGDRRFWPLEVKVVHLDKLKALRQQLFAEALHLLEAGERYHPTREEEREFVIPEQEQFKISDVWEDILGAYVSRSTNPAGEAAEDPPARRSWFSTRELFERALQIKADRIDSNKIMETRLGNCMKALGFSRYRQPDGVQRPRGYLRPGCKYGEAVSVDLPPVRKTSSQAPGMEREPGEDDDVPI